MFSSISILKFWDQEFSFKYINKVDGQSGRHRKAPHNSWPFLGLTYISKLVISYIKYTIQSKVLWIVVEHWSVQFASFFYEHCFVNRNYWKYAKDLFVRDYNCLVNEILYVSSLTPSKAVSTLSAYEQDVHTYPLQLYTGDRLLVCTLW